MNVTERNEMWLNFLSQFFNKELNIEYKELQLSHKFNKTVSISINKIFDLNIDASVQWGYFVLHFENTKEKKLFLNISNLYYDVFSKTQYDINEYPSRVYINSGPSEKSIAFYDLEETPEENILKNRIITFKSIVFSLTRFKIALKWDEECN
jgi:hypothetical protein